MLTRSLEIEMHKVATAPLHSPPLSSCMQIVQYTARLSHLRVKAWYNCFKAALDFSYCEGGYRCKTLLWSEQGEIGVSLA